MEDYTITRPSGEGDFVFSPVASLQLLESVDPIEASEILVGLTMHIGRATVHLTPDAFCETHKNKYK